MNGKGPGAAWYVLPALLPVAGAALFAGTIFGGLMSIESRLQEVVVPGRAEMDLSEAGTYTIYYEHRASIGARTFDTGVAWPGLDVTVQRMPEGEPVEVRTPAGLTRYEIGPRAGASVLEFAIDRPGRYEVAAAYPAGSEGPEVAIAVSKGLMGYVAARVVGGLVACLGSVLLAMGLALVVYFKRRSARRRAAEAAAG